jgi:hypothetical protein
MVQYKIIAVIVFIVSSYLIGLHTGKMQELRKQETVALKANVKQQQASVKTVTEYVDKVKVVRQKGETIIKEVPVYITKDVDGGCIIPDSFGLLWNTSNSK